ncbi:T. brucei spp.-specific protein [Trypanosoma brucei gambiense DAL972]|uniref:T. brucei spp.-specific protein n=1 Tax=Trypanosoma brucei gambiense (strain MHOM/CI/86/DAL972) TaxID=679716 RepID=D0A573_TRYB9|nr:T. brucei spp.-specific protein [Trypanosoma brucei gambiense DAL972]CBH16417.1 T. brucei spp.-specific protein [Trypanosoma brucei gambiense DAL972]|eukprot:XP_011778681.1 T. brucei spp.-specific protein [Trypanosoma brucei gambiense DAL972]
MQKHKEECATFEIGLGRNAHRSDLPARILPVTMTTQLTGVEKIIFSSFRAYTPLSIFGDTEGGSPIISAVVSAKPRQSTGRGGRKTPSPPKYI